ncbi:MAG TPA: hypothetical protein VF221_17305 [Chloroflexota bacterium]
MKHEATALRELRRHQVYRLQRTPKRSVLRLLRRALRLRRIG